MGPGLPAVSRSTSMPGLIADSLTARPISSGLLSRLRDMTCDQNVTYDRSNGRDGSGVQGARGTDAPEAARRALPARWPDAERAGAEAADVPLRRHEAPG